MPIKSTTRHIQIYAATIENDQMFDSETMLTLDIDPDNELNWNDTALQKVYRQFDAIVAAYKGADLTDYNLRRMGSDLEHFVRGLLQSGEISYNLNHRALNYSMGLPQVIDTNAQ